MMAITDSFPIPVVVHCSILMIQKTPQIGASTLSLVIITTVVGWPLQGLSPMSLPCSQNNRPSI